MNILKLYGTRNTVNVNQVRVHPSLVNVYNELITSVGQRGSGNKKTTARDVPQVT
jgi:hypothetical protein